MPVIHDNHLKRAKFERGMADMSATNVERIIHTKLADLHAEANTSPPTDATTGAGKL